jgi:hypothetical protein
MEARAGIEPALKDLQSSASPLGHRAISFSKGKENLVTFLRGKIQIEMLSGHS